MRLVSTVLLAVMSALFLIGSGNITLAYADNAATPWFLSVLFPAPLFLGLNKATEEDIMLLLFAVSGVLLSFGNTVTTGAGFILLLVALFNFSQVISKHARLAWGTAATVCVLVPCGFMRLISLVFA